MKKGIVLLLLCFVNVIIAQDLDEILEQETPKVKQYASATFKGTRLLNGHSVENRKKGVTEFIVSHRFGRINLGLKEFYGLDQSNIRIALERAVSDKLMIGFGRSSFDKTYDGFLKYKLLRQRTDKNVMPFSVSVFGSAAYQTLNDLNSGDELTFSQKLTYVSQLLIARKFSPGFSLQIMPGYIYRNSVKTNEDPHGIVSLGIGGRMKFTKRLALNFEYHYTVNPLQYIDTTNSIAFGLEIETGGHVFQIVLSNAITMIEKSFITESTDNFFEGDIHLGFNISRAFHGKQKKRKK